MNLYLLYYVFAFRYTLHTYLAKNKLSKASEPQIMNSMNIGLILKMVKQ